MLCWIGWDMRPDIRVGYDVPASMGRHEAPRRLERSTEEGSETAGLLEQCLQCAPRGHLLGQRPMVSVVDEPGPRAQCAGQRQVAAGWQQRPRGPGRSGEDGQER